MRGRNDVPVGLATDSGYYGMWLSHYDRSLTTNRVLFWRDMPSSITQRGGVRGRRAAHSDGGGLTMQYLLAWRGTARTKVAGA
jgi:hypothetical protein